jgi:ribonuclease HI
LSTIIRTPKLRKKFKKFIEALLEGRDIRSAGNIASLAAGEITPALEALASILSEAPEREKGNKVSPLGLVVFSDGASRGNPGKSACAVIIYDASGEELLRRTKILGVATNNVAEYEGVLLGLQLARDLGAAELHLKLDSELVVRQLNGAYKVKSTILKPLYLQAVRLLSTFPQAIVTYVPRKENKEADVLVNKALDGKK